MPDFEPEYFLDGVPQSEPEPSATGPLAEVLAEFFEQTTHDNVIRTINKVGGDVYREWTNAGFLEPSQHLHTAIREAAYRAVRELLKKDYVHVEPEVAI
jgi:aminoglycoside phosphotransferase family enzyme